MHRAIAKALRPVTNPAPLLVQPRSLAMASARKKLWRERQAAGVAVLSVAVELVATEEALIAEQFLLPADREDRDKVTAALERMISAFIIDARR
jgi:hypothetical protein